MSLVNGWLCLIQRGDHRKQHEEIYKICRTNDFNLRFNEFSPYSQIIAVSRIDDDRKYEQELIREFKKEFEFRNDIGHEYFEGDERAMISVFNDYYRIIYQI
jgi:hypothetical protein